MHSYRFTLLLIGALCAGSVTGVLLKDKAAFFKPFGDVFLNLLFTAVVPLVFFSISSAVAGMSSGRRLGKILLYMLIVFVATGTVASLLMIAAVKAFPPAQGVQIALEAPADTSAVTLGDAIVRAFTVSDFVDLLSKRSMLALIIFSILIGLATATAGERAAGFRSFLTGGNEVFSKVIGYIMLYAPVGLGAYFAYLIGVFGPQLFGSYFRAMLIYYPLAVLYFFGAFSLYALMAAGRAGVGTFWRNIFPAAVTALGTGSSVASIPLNLEAAEKSGVPEDIREVVIPIGATIHMDGSCLSAVLKIALLFGIFQMDFAGPGTLLTTLAVALLSGTVMSGIPSGGFLGEVMIVTLYGFPPEALPVISLIGALVDPPATMVNAVGDNVSSMLVARWMGGPQWQEVKA
ncbi:MAG: dicarboxylate/amino acid:cation symporter [Candidatus Omnitrophica bacterium]|nr:dicarboxylate/amino acid:cation symporter [Candidatus Omnitrophota bacterium]